MGFTTKNWREIPKAVGKRGGQELEKHRRNPIASFKSVPHAGQDVIRRNLEDTGLAPSPSRSGSSRSYTPGERLTRLPKSPQAPGEQETGQSGIAALEEQYRKKMMQDLAMGKERGRELFGGGMDLSAMTGSHLQGLQAQASGGLSAPHLASVRSAAAAGLAQQQANRMRDLRLAQGASGVRGAAGAALQLRGSQMGDIARRNLEADLAARDIGVRQAGMQALGQALNRERLGQLSTEFGYAGLGAQTRGMAAETFYANQLRQEALDRLLGRSPHHRMGTAGSGIPGYGNVGSPGGTIQPPGTISIDDRSAIEEERRKQTPYDQSGIQFG
jgi:hypothetical protein